MRPKPPKYKAVYSKEEKAYFLDIANRVRKIREAATNRQPIPTEKETTP
jgi:hypothetical protein